MVMYDGELTSVRIHGIKAPERNTPEGPASTATLGDLCGRNCLQITRVTQSPAL